jgi:hypothetical protein
MLTVHDDNAVVRQQKSRNCTGINAAINPWGHWVLPVGGSLKYSMSTLRLRGGGTFGLFLALMRAWRGMHLGK